MTCLFVTYWLLTNSDSINFFSHSNPRFSTGITRTQAQATVQAAHEKALEMGVSMNVAVVDAGANLVAFLRKDDAGLDSLDISIKKAQTARFFDMFTDAIGDLSQPGGPVFGIEHSNGEFISFPGGIPIKGDGAR